MATGGLSYPTTGSTGDGYRFAREAGHTVTDLAPLWFLFVQKKSIFRNGRSFPEKCGADREKRKKSPLQGFGEMMFTHSGITGPLVLSASARLGTALRKSGELSAFLDLKPCAYAGAAGCQNTERV